jgi:hypothetical protein
MIKKIVSGGQTGADQAALDAAIELGVPHGGWIPKGRKTETGPLSGESLTWTLDEDIALGTGETVMIHELPRRIPLGFIPMPLEIGSHSIRLTVTDSEGNESSADLAIEIVADSDRDGFSDQDEKAFGGDPLDPFARPGDLDEDDDGLLVPPTLSQWPGAGLAGLGQPQEKRGGPAPPVTAREQPVLSVMWSST